MSVDTTKLNTEVNNKTISSVVFLDIDGVLFNNREDGSVQKKAAELFPNVERPYESYHCNVAATHLFNQQAVSNLETLVNTVENVSIVLSSTWRTGRTVSEAREMLAKHAFSALIIDKTPDDTDTDYCEYQENLQSDLSERALEITYWLKTHSQINNFVILDDYDNGLSKTFGSRFVKVDSKKLLSPENILHASMVLAAKV